MEKFLKCLEEIEKHIAEQQQKCIVLLESGNLVDTIYGSIALRWYKKQDYYTILMVNKKYIDVHEGNADKVFGFQADNKFRFMYRKELMKRSFQWLAPHPSFVREFPELMLRTPIILDQYLINANASPNIWRMPKCTPTSEDIEFTKNFAIKKHLNLSNTIVIDNSQFLPLQEIIFKVRSLQLGVISFSEKSYQAAVDGTVLSFRQRAALLNCVPFIIGQANEMSILSLTCQQPPKIIEIAVNKFSSLKTVFKYNKCISLFNNKELIINIINALAS